MDPSLATLAARIVLISGGIKAGFVAMGFLLARTRAAAMRQVYRVPLMAGQLRRELKAAVLVILFDGMVIFAFGALFADRFVATTPLTLAVGFSWMFISFEVWFYFTHRLMHTKALYRIHAQHHVAHVSDPLSALSFSLVERGILLGGGLGLSELGTYFLPMAHAGLFAYAILNYFLTVLGHANIECVPECVVQSCVGNAFLTPTFHSMHHARYKGHYGLFTTTLDRLFGTVFDDYEAVHARARVGQGLTQLGQRLEPLSARETTADERAPQLLQPQAIHFARRPSELAASTANEG